MKNDHNLRGSGSVAVIGAGVGGMCTAARLAHAGFEVTIFEASHRYGGKCRTEWFGDFAFDTGPTLLTLPAVYRDFFQRTGDVMGRLVNLIAVDPSFDYRFTDGSHIKFANLSRKKTLAAIESTSGETASKEWDAALLQAERMWDASREVFIESELTSPFSLLKRRTLLKDLATIAPWKSLRKIKFSDNKLRNIMDRYATYSGSDPRKAPAVLSTIAFIEEAFGAWHIEGGIGKLADAIYQRCLDRGVSFRFNTEIVEVTHADSQVNGIVTSSGERFAFDKVVANIDALTLYSTLIKSPPRNVRRERDSINKAEPSLSGFSLFLSLNTVTQLEHHTIIFPENYDDEFDQIFDKKIAVTDPTIYICAPKDPMMVKHEGTQGLSILINSPRHEPENGFDWSNREFNLHYSEKIIDLIESRGISIRPYLIEMHMRTPCDLQDQVMAPGGSIYGTSSNGPRSAFLRAKNRSPLKNLYCVGGSAHPGGGLPLVGLSSEIVALAALDGRSS